MSSTVEYPECKFLALLFIIQEAVEGRVGLLKKGSFDRSKDMKELIQERDRNGFILNKGLFL